MERLQGYEMRNMRSKLKFISYSESSKGNIRANLALKNSDKATYYHWLNDEEKAKFKSSEYYNPKYKVNNTKTHLKCFELSENSIDKIYNEIKLPGEPRYYRIYQVDPWRYSIEITRANTQINLRVTKEQMDELQDWLDGYNYIDDTEEYNDEE